MREQIMAQMKDAMKSGDKIRLGTVRLIQAAIKDKDIEVRVEGRTAISNDEILTLLQKMTKQRRESAEIYRQNNRPELADNEEAEIKVIASFLPQPMEEAEVKAAIQAVVAEINANSIKDMGRVIAALKERYTGRIDFSNAKTFVEEALKK